MGAIHFGPKKDLIKQQVENQKSSEIQYVDRIIEKRVEVPVLVDRPVETIIERHIPIEIIKEVPVEVIKYVDKVIEVIKEVPVEVIKTIHEYIDKPIEVIKNVEIEVLKEHVPNWIRVVTILQTIVIVYLLLK